LAYAAPELAEGEAEVVVTAPVLALAEEVPLQGI